MLQLSLHGIVGRGDAGGDKRVIKEAKRKAEQEFVTEI